MLSDLTYERPVPGRGKKRLNIEEASRTPEAAVKKSEQSERKELEKRSDRIKRVLGTRVVRSCFFVTGFGHVQPYVAIFAFGSGLEAISLAIDPTVLFERVTYAQLKKGEAPRRYGYAAAISIVAKISFILAALFFVASMYG